MGAAFRSSFLPDQVAAMDIIAEERFLVARRRTDFVDKFDNRESSLGKPSFLPPTGHPIGYPTVSAEMEA